MPLLEKVGHMAKEKYSHGPELLALVQNIAKHLVLFDKVLFQTEVRHVRWYDDQQRANLYGGGGIKYLESLTAWRVEDHCSWRGCVSPGSSDGTTREASTSKGGASHEVRGRVLRSVRRKRGPGLVFVSLPWTWEHCRETGAQFTNSNLIALLSDNSHSRLKSWSFLVPTVLNLGGECSSNFTAGRWQTRASNGGKARLEVTVYQSPDHPPARENQL